MAVGVVQEFKNATLGQYDQVVQKMGFRPGGPGAPGGIFHWVTEVNGGLRITDVWESREAFENFAREQIGPYAQEVGIDSPPDVTFYEVHNYLTAGSAM
jgi:hypothetical protein